MTIVIVLILGFIGGAFASALVLSLIEEKDFELHMAERSRQLQVISSVRDDLRKVERENARLREQNGKLFDQWAQAHGWDRV